LLIFCGQTDEERDDFLVALTEKLPFNTNGYNLYARLSQLNLKSVQK